MKLQKRFKDVLKLFQGCWKDASMILQRGFKDVSMIHQKCLKDALRTTRISFYVVIVSRQRHLVADQVI